MQSSLRLAVRGVSLHGAKPWALGSAIKRSPRLLRCFGGCKWFSAFVLGVADIMLISIRSARIIPSRQPGWRRYGALASNRRCAERKCSEASLREISRLMLGRLLFFWLLMQTTRMEFASMSENEFGDFIAFVPHQIEANWDEKWGPLLAGLPLNIMYACVQRAELDQTKMLGITACYEPDLATFRETKKTRELTYFNREGGSYSVRVVLNKKSGRLETFKYKGKKLIASASGRDFDSAMVHTTLVGIERDEQVTVIRD